MTNSILPHAIRPSNLKNPKQRPVATGGEEDHHPHPKTLKHPTSSTDVGTTTMPDQRLVATGGEEDHQPHPKTLEHRTSSTDVGKTTMPDQSHQPHPKTMEHPTSPMDDGTTNKPVIPTVSIKSRHDAWSNFKQAFT